MKVTELRTLAAKRKIDLTGAKTKAQIIEKLSGKVEKKAAAATTPAKKAAAKSAQVRILTIFYLDILRFTIFFL